jgi:galactose mutarotase-like enzyme
MNTTISQTHWQGLSAFTLETDTLRVAMVPEMGAKLVSIFDKRSQREWLVGPGQRPFKKVPYGAAFQEQDMSGWDEMFPTISACDYPGSGARHLALPDHGEVWTLAWKVEQASAGKISLSVDGPALPYRLTRVAELTEADVLQLTYHLVNLGLESLPYLWAAHPQFACGPDAQIRLPDQVTTVLNALPETWGWGDPETYFDWPEALTPDGRRVRLDRVGPPGLQRARKFFAPPETQVAWAGLVRWPARDWLRMEWDPDCIPYLGLWVDEGAISTESVAAPEPMTGFYDNLAVAWNKKRVSILEPGASQSWTLRLRVGTGKQPFPTDH